VRAREVFRFELAAHARRPATWLSAALLLGLPLALAGGGANPVGTGTLLNAPVKVATMTLLVGLLGTVVTAALFVEAGHRDARWRMEPLFHASPLRRAEYLGGRFGALLLVNALLLLAVPAGLALATRLPGTPPASVGPMLTETYLLPYLLFLLPSLLVNAAVLFGVTVLTRRSLPGYLGALGLVVAYLTTVNLAGGSGGAGAAALLDPTGGVALMARTAAWTRAELDGRAIDATGLLLANRLLWAAFGLAMLALTYARFRPVPATGRAGRRPSNEKDEGRAGDAGRAVAVPRAPRVFGARGRLRQTAEMAALAFRETVLGRDFLLLAAGLFGVTLLMALESMTDPFGGAYRPTTHRLVAMLGGRFVDVPIALLTVFYAGELVWRERDAGMEKMLDSAPVPDWMPLAAKLLALAGMLAVLQGVLAASGVVAQLALGGAEIEPDLYLSSFFGFQLADHLLFAVLALAIHAVADQRHLASLAGVLAYLAIGQAPRFGVEHNLLIYGGDPGWAHSDMAGFGPFVGPFAWFKLYWAAWAALLGVLALLAWRRGAGTGVHARVRVARARLTRRVSLAAGGAAALVVATGGFLFHNTNVRNPYRTADAAEAREAEYERRYGRFEHAPQPWLVGMRLHVDLRPERRSVAVRGSYRLVNRTARAIDSVHLSAIPYPGATLSAVRFDRAATPVLRDDTLGYRIYRLDRPLAPGDTLRMAFDARLAPNGFENRGMKTLNTAVEEDGTYLEMFRLLPAIGYQHELQGLSSPAARLRQGLPPRPVAAAADDPRGLRRPRSAPHADWIAFEATVTTAPDQTAVLPGTLVRTWTAGGRRWFHYRADAPVLPSIALASARYAERRGRWSGGDVRLLHHPAHAWNAARTMEATRAALEYHGAEFGPLPHRAYTVMEIPGYDGTFGRAHPASLVYTEQHPIAVGRAEEGRMDTPLLVVAHEVGHQWWGHRMMGADVAGSQVLSETLAQYGAAMVMERVHGPEAARGFLAGLHVSYLEARGDGAQPELPLVRTAGQEHVHYRKGAVAMYALREYAGEARVNAALRKMVERYGMRGPPYPTAADLHRALAAEMPDSLRPLLDDLFLRVTLWDVRAPAARAVPLGDGRYRVTLEVEAAKYRTDAAGNDREAPMDDLVEIAVRAEPGPGDRGGRELYRAMHRVRSGRQSVTVTVRGRPATAGIDPRRLLLTRDRDALLGDPPNVAPVAIAGETAER
jgi:ABC-2 type transport system permease protein